MIKNIPTELADPVNLTARSLENDGLEWRFAFNTGHYARFRLVHRTELKRHYYELFSPVDQPNSYHKAILRKPIHRSFSIEFCGNSPSGAIRAIYHIIKQYANE